MFSISRASAIAVGAVFALALQIAPAGAQVWFDLARYNSMKESDRQNLEFVLTAMYEAVFYAQQSVGKPVVCSSPIPIPGPRLVEMVDQEIAAPTNPMQTSYEDVDHVAFVLMHALKTEGICD